MKAGDETRIPHNRRASMLFIAMSLLLLSALLVLGLGSIAISGPAALYPRVLIISGILLLIICSVQSWFGRANIPEDPELTSLHTGSTNIRVRFAAFCILWVIYPLAMPFLGFIASSVLAFYGSSLLFGNTRHIATLLWTIVFVVIFSILLKLVIYVPVPTAWPDKMIDSLIYRF